MTKNKIKVENVLVDLEAKSKEAVIEKLAQQLHQSGQISDLTLFIADVFDREAHMTTGIGNGLAIPHGKSDAVIESTIAVAKLKESVDWQSLDDKPVEFVFLLAIKNADKGEAHLKILAELSAQLMNDRFVEKIKQSQTKTELCEALQF